MACRRAVGAMEAASVLGGGRYRTFWEYTEKASHLSFLVARGGFTKEVIGKLKPKGQFGISRVTGGMELSRARKQQRQRHGSWRRTSCV